MTANAFVIVTLRVTPVLVLVTHCLTLVLRRGMRHTCVVVAYPCQSSYRRGRQRFCKEAAIRRRKTDIAKVLTVPKRAGMALLRKSANVKEIRIRRQTRVSRFGCALYDGYAEAVGRISESVLRRTVFRRTDFRIRPHSPALVFTCRVIRSHNGRIWKSALQCGACGTYPLHPASRGCAKTLR
jgi:hypothetical protein